MSIADKLLRAKKDLYAVYVAGKAAGGGEVTEKVIEPYHIEENSYWNYQEEADLDLGGCDTYTYKIDGMFGKTAKIKAIIPEHSCIRSHDGENFIDNSFAFNHSFGNYAYEGEIHITGNEFEIIISCVRTEGYPQVTVVGSKVSHTSCFDGTINGEYIDDEIKYLRYGAFADCKNITKVSLPNCEEFGGNYIFYNMVKVTEFSLPKVKRGSFGATFMGCSIVTKIDLSGLGGVEIGAQCFRNCVNLKSVIFGGNAINTLANTNALLGTPTTMSIYVPDDLVDAYKENSTWVSYTSRIKSWTEGGITL